MHFGVHLFPADHFWLKYAFFPVNKAYNEWFLFFNSFFLGTMSCCHAKLGHFGVE